MSNTSHPLPSIFAYHDYRTWFNDLIRHLKATDQRFSVRDFSLKLGISHTMLYAIMKGTRGLLPSTAARIGTALSLSEREIEYLVSCCHYKRSSTVDEKDASFQQMNRTRRNSATFRINKKTYAYADTWYYAVLRELAVYADWKNDYEILAALVKPAITPAQARLAVKELLALGLLVRNERGALMQTSTTIVANNLPPHLLAKLRLSHLDLAKAALENHPKIERHHSGSTLAVTEAGFKEITHLADEFRERALAIAAREKKPTRVYQINVQVFSVSNSFGESTEALPSEHEEKKR